MLSQRFPTPAVSAPRSKQASAVIPDLLNSSSPAVVDLWHLFSLDAPTVAVTWLLFVNSCAGVLTGAPTAAALFVTVWAIYTADRLLDGDRSSRMPSGTATARMTLPPDPQSDLELRHHFHHRHRRAFTAWMAILIPVLVILLCRLPGNILLPEAALAVPLAVWLKRVHRVEAGPASRPLPKEFVVGPFFAAAVCLPAAAHHASGPSLLLGGALFAALCTLNCLFLYAWEHPRNLFQAHSATRFAVRHLLPLAGASLLAAGMAYSVERDSPLRPISLACASSTTLLIMLHALRRRFSPLRLRALADLVLLTPALQPAMRLAVHGHALLAGR